MLKNRDPYEFPKNELKQEYNKYTNDDHEVWQILYSRQEEALKDNATKDFFEGMKLCGFASDKIPHIETVNDNLLKATGWQTYVVPGLIADKPFFQFLANKRFPVTTWIRKKHELEYLEEPDMFHDVYAHVPLLSIQSFVDFVQGLAKIALKHIENAEAVELLSRLYWFTVEFGLINEDNHLKIYGAGILSSIGESDYSVHDKNVPRYPYDVRHIFRTPYYKHDFQKQYFVIDSYEQLYESLDHIEEILEDELEKENVKINN
ncbi:MAG: phenylalanine 4-monooxygenase [Chitinophagales bacterium]